MHDEDRARWARALTTAGWLFLLAYLSYLTSQIRRAFSITEASFEDGLWWQRVEQISFASLPQNAIIMAPAAAAAVGAALLTRERSEQPVLGLRLLVQLVAGTSYVIIAAAILGIMGIYARTPDNVSDFAALLGRSGGIAMAVAMIRVCLEADRST